MFALFYSLYCAMFTGIWYNYTLGQMTSSLKEGINGIGLFLTSIFGDNTYSDLGTILTNVNSFGISSIVSLTSLILALITSIGIVVMAVKGIKRVFSIFFMPIR